MDPDSSVATHPWRWIWCSWWQSCDNRTYEPTWGIDSPFQASVTKRPMQRNILDFVRLWRGGGWVKLSYPKNQ